MTSSGSRLVCRPVCGLDDVTTRLLYSRRARKSTHATRLTARARAALGLFACFGCVRLGGHQALCTRLSSLASSGGDGYVQQGLAP